MMVMVDGIHSGAGSDDDDVHDRGGGRVGVMPETDDSVGR